MENLKKMYTLNSQSFDEKLMFDLVCEELTKLAVPFEVDDKFQIWRINSGEPILSAHLDQVQPKSPSQVVEVSGNLVGFDSQMRQRGLGADDKNGVWLILEALRRFPNVSFIFSSGEEAGGQIQHLDLDLSDSPFCLVLDRRGSSDIIGSLNGYCKEDLESWLTGLNPKFESVQGVWSDADYLSGLVPCVNLSVGYYNAHSDSEYTSVTDLLGSLDFILTILNEDCPRKFELSEGWLVRGLDLVSSSEVEVNCPFYGEIHEADCADSFWSGDDMCSGCEIGERLEEEFDETYETYEDLDMDPLSPDVEELMDRVSFGKATSTGQGKDYVQSVFLDASSIGSLTTRCSSLLNSLSETYQFHMEDREGLENYAVSESETEGWVWVQFETLASFIEGWIWLVGGEK